MPILALRRRVGAVALLLSAAASCGSEGTVRLLEARSPDVCSSVPIGLSYRTAFGGRIGYRITAVEVVHAPACAGRRVQITLRDSAGTVADDGSAIITPRTTLTVVAIAGRPAAELVVGSTVQMDFPAGSAPLPMRDDGGQYLGRRKPARLMRRSHREVDMAAVRAGGIDGSVSKAEPFADQADQILEAIDAAERLHQWAVAYPG